MTRAVRLALLLLAAASPLLAQGTGAIAGRVLDADTRLGLDEAQVTLVGIARSAVTDTAGVFRLRQVPPGWVRLRVVRFGYRPAVRESVLVRAGETAVLEIALAPSRPTVDTLRAIDITTAPDIVLDPLIPQMVQRITGEELRMLPITTLEQAVTLSAGAVGTSYRGGRLGQESYILDGLQVKNQLDASTNGLGLRIPPDLLTEASLITNGFSARYGQALSGLINVVTRDGGDVWSARLAYENDRPLPDDWDYGQDRLVFAGDGPVVGPVRIAFAGDVRASLDADPVAAPPPTDTLDPRSTRPNINPSAEGEAYDLAGKLTAPLGGGHTLRLFGLASAEQRRLFDPVLKYDPRWTPGRRVSGGLASAHWQYASTSRAARSFVSDVRLAYFTRDFVRGALAEEPDHAFGGFTGTRFGILGEDIARAQDTLAARAPIPGYARPDYASAGPWGAPAFFLAGGGRGDLGWNHLTELRGQLDLNVGWRTVDLFAGGEVTRQHVQTFQRVLSYLPVGDSVPPVAASDFEPLQAAAYAEAQIRLAEVAVSAGLRYDAFDPRTTVAGEQTRARSAFSPRFAVSTVLSGATVVVSYGKFQQSPDFQYLVDAAFDDTTRTGRFRAGNPNLGFESATQYEFSLRMRPRPHLALRLNAFVKRLEGMVASVPLGLDPDSTIFGNLDQGSVKGFEVLLERDMTAGWGYRVLYSFQKAEATATDAYELVRRIRVDPGGTDTIIPAAVEFPLDYDRRHGLTLVGLARIADHVGPHWGRVSPLAGLELSGIARVATGLPYSRTNAEGDTLIGLPNSWRLPTQYTLDALVRRPFTVRGVRAGAYLDIRNILGTRNVVAVRRDTGQPGMGPAGLDSAAAQAYRAHPEPIPYESPRYRAWADANGDGYVRGTELQVLYRRAAQDFYQPLFAYGAPRLMRLGLEVIF